MHSNVLCFLKLNNNINLAWDVFYRYGQTGTGKTFTMEGKRSMDSSINWDDVRTIAELLLNSFKIESV